MNKPNKINSFKGTTTYTMGDFNIRVTRKTISERVGCGRRSNISVSSWYAVDKSQIEKPGISGYGGIRDAAAKLNQLATA